MIYIRYFFLSFSILFILTLNFSYNLLPNLGEVISPVSEYFIQFSGNYIFGIQSEYTIQTISDSTGLYINLFNISILSIYLIIIIRLFRVKESRLFKYEYYLNIILLYYLSLLLIDYGLIKVFKWQFYDAEPNILHTPVGFLNKNMLYWTSLGTSYSFNIITGFLELTTGILLWFRKTKFLGLVLSFLLLSHIVLVNFSFNIDVKVLSTFLLILSLYFLFPYLKEIIRFFNQKNAQINIKNSLRIPRKTYLILKIILITIIISENIYPYLKTGIFNGDNAKKPMLYGTYEVYSNNETDIKRIHFHSKNYFIVQYKNDSFKDYELSIDTNLQLLHLNDKYSNRKLFLEYSKSGNNLELNGILNIEKVKLSCIKQDLNQLPLNQNTFHWTIDSYN